jgi:hypothetical protein
MPVSFDLGGYGPDEITRRAMGSYLQGSQGGLPAPQFMNPQGQSTFGGGVGMYNRTPTPAATLPMVFNGGQQYQSPQQGQPQGQPAATLPMVFNGGQQYQSPQQGQPQGPSVRDDVIRGMGGRGGQMPSMAQFLGQLPQSSSMNFSAGSGQIGNGLGIGGPPTQGYTPASQGPVTSSDHTAAGMQAFNQLLGQHTTGPESPTQAAARVMQQQNDLLRTMSEDRHRTGTLGVAQAQEDRARWEQQQRLSPEGRLAQAEAFLMQQPGMNATRARQQLSDYVRNGFFGPAGGAPPATSWQNPGMNGQLGQLSGFGQLPPAGGITGGTGGAPPAIGALPPGGGTPPPAAAPGATGGTRVQQAAAGNRYDQAAGNQTGPDYSSIEPQLNEVRARAGGANDVGTFLARLNRSNPGLVQQHWPSIQAYLQDSYGRDNYLNASQGVRQLGGMTITPTQGHSGTSWLLSPFTQAAEAARSLIGGNRMTEEQEGRAMLANYLRGH